MTAPERFADSQIPLAPWAPSIHDPSQLPQAAFERGHARLCLWVAGDKTHQHTDAPHPFGLRERRKRPSDRAAEKRDKFAASYAEHGDFLPRDQSSHRKDAGGFWGRP